MCYIRGAWSKGRCGGDIWIHKGGVQKKIMGSPDRMDRSLETGGLVRRKQRGVRSARQSRRHMTGQPGTGKKAEMTEWL